MAIHDAISTLVIGPRFGPSSHDIVRVVPLAHAFKERVLVEFVGSTSTNLHEKQDK
jgi:hypothetical protein